MIRLLCILRWVIFLPAGIVGGFFFSAVFKTPASIFPELIRYIISGMSGAAGMILVGLWVAPQKTAVVKWALISMVVTIGTLSAIQHLTGVDDKLKAASGIALALTALAFSGLKMKKDAGEKCEESASPNNK